MSYDLLKSTVPNESNIGPYSTTLRDATYSFLSVNRKQPYDPPNYTPGNFFC